MDGIALQDKIARGLGTAARAIGVLCNAYRPVGSATPLASGNRFVQLSAAFNAQDPGFRNAALPSQAMWYGVFDSAYLLPGDYLVELASGRTWFVASLQSLLPAVCVLTNRVVSASRPGTLAVAGVNQYGGGATSAPVISGFPASLLHGDTIRGSEALPADARVSGAVVLLPAIGDLGFARGDVLSDDLGRSYVVAQCEQNELGWRLDTRQAAS